MKTLKIITTAVFLLFTVSAFAQTKEETLQWLRDHLKTLVIHNNDSILPYTMTKTYTFYDDAFVMKTLKDFYKDTSLNSPPAFAKIWYKDIFTEKDTAIVRGLQKEPAGGKGLSFTIWAERVYSIIGREDAPLPFWRTFDEPMGLELSLPENKTLSIQAIQKLYQLATSVGAKEKSSNIIPDENSGEY